MNDTLHHSGDRSAPWPYPRWIAHRGAGQLAPENTLAAFRLGAAHGYRMFECDAKLSADGVVFLLHDDTLDRTSNGHGLGSDLSWSDLSQLDAGSWHSRPYAGEPPPTLAAVARFCRANGCLLNIEIKPTPGTEAATGRAVALAAAQLWNGPGRVPGQPAPPDQPPPLLSSFQPEALAAAQAAAPALPRGLLLETLWTGWLETAHTLGCAAVICDELLWDQTTLSRVHRAGLRALAYTVNETASAERLIGLGLDGLITDRIDRFDPQGPMST